MSAIDDIDRQILSLLVGNGRATHTAIGERVGLSPHAVADRIRRLAAAGVIQGFTAVLDFGSIGRGLDAIVDARLQSTASPEAFEQHALSIEPVRELAFVTGRFDYQLRVACVDADDLDHTVRSLRKHGAAVTETRIVLRSQTAAHPAA